MSLRIVSAESGRHFRDFIDLPWTIYRGDPVWVPPLKREVRSLLSLRHPFYRHAERNLFLCLDGSTPVGRIAGIINHRHNEFHGEKTGFFGFFESLPEYAVADALFRAAEDWLVRRGMDLSRGPVNPSTNEECGLLVDNFLAPPFVMMTYNQPYYASLVERSGYRKAKDLYAYFFDVGQKLPDRLVRLDRIIRDREKDLTIRPVDLKEFSREIETVKRIYNEAWEKNWGFVPMTDEEMDHMAKKLKPLAVPDMVVLAFIGQEPAAFLMALPDFNQVLRILNGRLITPRIVKALRVARRIRNPRIVTLGVREKFRKKGLEAPLFAYAWGKGIERGDLYGEFSWLLEDNRLINETVVKVFGASLYKTYRIYDKPL
ncbi:MAG: N-acetyltransferase [bacterium]|nr:MAG: N-acetyltransferase [bacterium]